LRASLIELEPLASELELLARAASIAGRTIAELCLDRGEVCPVDQRRHKGFVGNLIERVLGATAPVNAAGPDFDRLGIELKTIPMSRARAATKSAAEWTPRESTFVCVANLGAMVESSWEQSPVRRKLARVLWLPIEAEPDVALRDRRVGRAVLWSPSPEQDALLAADWDELAARIASGEVESITAHVGRWLQLRPKAAHSGVLGRARDERGALLRARPKGFYLRRESTAAIMRGAL
jgi:DNA mismatch repair protein MutH